MNSQLNQLNFDDFPCLRRKVTFEISMKNTTKEKKNHTLVLSSASLVQDPSASSQSLLISPQCSFHPLLIASLQHKFFPSVFFPHFSMIFFLFFVMAIRSSYIFFVILFEVNCVASASRLSTLGVKLPYFRVQSTISALNTAAVTHC